MAGNIKQRFKQGINRIKGRFDRSPSGSQPSTSSTQLAFTPPTSVIDLQSTPDAFNQPSAPSDTAIPNLQRGDGGQNPPAAPILPAPYSTSQNAKREGWAELKTFVNLLSKGADLFGPLKEPMHSILMCVETFESVAKNREDYQRLKTELTALFHDLPGYFGESTPSDMRPSIVDLARGIEQELGLIREKPNGYGVKPHLKAGKDAEDVLACYRRIQGLFERFMINANFSTWKIVAEQTTEAQLKNLPSSPDAMYRSAKSASLRGACTSDTRVQVLEQLRDWAYDGKSEKIYWMNGMAGTGKTTIAYSLCERLESTVQLAASFFCSRQLPECRDVNRIIPTISYQLARFSRPFRYAISQVLEKNPDVHNQSLLDQFRKLILEPLNQIKDTLPTDLIVMIDALDECDDDDGGDRILDVLLSSAQELPVKFFVTSRPEAKILDRMQGRDGKHTELRLHELARSSVQEDIRTYLTAKLGSSRMTIPADDLNTLVERSGVLFIYAATVVRYIGRDNFARGAKRLEEVLSVSGSSSSGSNKGIDALYTAILKAAFDDPDLPEPDRAEMKLILDTIICAQESPSVDVIAGLLRLDGASVQAALRPLRSVLHVSDTTHIVTTLHESFPDYLRNKGRSDRFHCDVKEQNARLAQLCFDHISIPSPPFNICNLESSYVFDKEVPDLDTRVEKAISKELLYACRYWGAHLRSAKESQNLAGMLFKFLSNHLLLWMEVMNLKRCIYDGTDVLHRMQEWSQKAIWLDEDTKQLLRDAWMFIALFSSTPAVLSTPHIYVSTLSFWPDDRPITKHYPQQQPHLINGASTAMSAQEVIPLATTNTGGRITSLAYDDNIIHTRDACTGQSVKQPPRGHTAWVSSVACSPDGVYVTSGSDDNTIRIWDTRTCQSVGQPLQGHTNSVNSVAYSPDGAYIVSGSDDNTIRIWDARAGRSIGQPLRGHTDWVNSVTYSPDGAYIVSGSHDNTIRIWDARTGQSMGRPLRGHRSWVYSVAYSPDGAYIVSGSHDNSIRIWDARTGQSVGQPLQGHTHSINSVAYSPDGAYIASGSLDNTIRIWDARTSRSTGRPLRGHTYSVNSVAYSLDGAYIVSGSADNTIRIWDARTGRSIGQPLQGHTHWVNSVAYSPDGAYIISGSGDNIVRTWDTHSGSTMGNIHESGNNPAQTTIPSNPIPNALHAKPHICNLGCRINGPHIAWTLNDDGWVVIHKSKLLVWIPPDLRGVLLWPQNTAIISTHGFLQLDFHHRRIGDYWQEHFQPEKSGRAMTRITV